MTNTAGIVIYRTPILLKNCLGGIILKKTAVALVTYALVGGVPMTAFASTTPATLPAPSPTAQSMVQLKNLPVLINGVKYAQDNPYVKKVTRFVYDAAAKKQGVILGYTNQSLFNAQLKSAATARTNMSSNLISPQSVTYDSYFYQNLNYGGNYFGAASDISWVGSSWNDQISSLKAGYNHTWTVLCWNVNYRGSQFWVESGINVSYVGSTWNDQASSIFFYN